MTDDREQRIRIRAYEIWNDAGRPDGLDQLHWELAEHEIDSAAEAGLTEADSPESAAVPPQAEISGASEEQTAAEPVRPRKLAS